MLGEICRQNPRDAQAWFLLGAVKGQRGDLGGAVGCCRQALAIEPRHADAWFNLAQALMARGQVREAIRAYRKLLALRPNHVVALNNLGYALQQVGEWREAVACHQRALVLRPGDAEAWNHLGNALLGVGERAAAEDAYRRALVADPGCVPALNNLASLLGGRGEHEAAEAAYRKALESEPDNADTLVGLGMLIQLQGRAAEADALFRRASQAAPDSSKAGSALLFNLNYFETDGERIWQAHRAWGDRHQRPPAEGFPNRPDPERRLRVGYVSPDLRRHSVAFFFSTLLEHHDRGGFEVICYADVERPDDMTERLRKVADGWRDIRGLAPERVAEQVRADGIDILVDLAGHTVWNLPLVFARKPAPLQFTWLGYPNTTGMEVMDYRFTDAWADPPGQTEQWHSETLIRLPRGFLCYEPREEAGQPVTAPPCETLGHVTFGSFNTIAKVTPRVVEVWARILHAVPGSRLLLKNRALKSETVRKRYADLFEAQGIGPERIELLGWIPSAHSHLEAYSRVDIGLDPFPYNGTTTTCEALWMGVPVITLAGDRHVARVGVSLLSQVGLEDLIAGDQDGYVALATALATDTNRLRELRRTLRERMRASPLCDGPGFARQVEDAYREAWRTWCREAAPEKQG